MPPPPQTWVQPSTTKNDRQKVVMNNGLFPLLVRTTAYIFVGFCCVYKFEFAPQKSTEEEQFW